MSTNASYDNSGCFSVINRTCCPNSFDGYTNWTEAPAGTIAYKKCPNGPGKYNVNESASRICYNNGVWSLKSNYDKCIPTSDLSYGMIICWSVGYTVSLIVLVKAIILLRYFRSLRCLRNEIHCNLMVSFVFRILVWYFLVIPQIFSHTWPKILTTISQNLILFCIMANFFWMFVEGIYLFTIIVWTYGVDKFKIWHYSIIGWGVPLFSTTIVSIAMYFTHESIHSTLKFGLIHLPALISVICNIFILAVIVYNLVKKMKLSKVTVGRRSSKLSLFSTEYRKAIRAAAVLIPLLGISHFLFVFKPTDVKYPREYTLFNILMTSTQGFNVAVIYCFLNREVRFVIKAKYRSFRGYLPSTSRTRQTLDDSIGPIRRGNSAFTQYKPDSDSNVFNCRSYRLPKSNNGNNVTTELKTKEPGTENQET